MSRRLQLQWLILAIGDSAASSSLHGTTSSSLQEERRPFTLRHGSLAKGEGTLLDCHGRGAHPLRVDHDPPPPGSVQRPGSSRRAGFAEPRDFVERLAFAERPGSGTRHGEAEGCNGNSV